MFAIFDFKVDESIFTYLILFLERSRGIFSFQVCFFPRILAVHDELLAFKALQVVCAKNACPRSSVGNKSAIFETRKASLALEKCKVGELTMWHRTPSDI